MKHPHDALRAARSLLVLVVASAATQVTQAAEDFLDLNLREVLDLDRMRMECTGQGFDLGRLVRLARAIR